ncbi:hypothetical protein [Streptomyces sp. NPDC054794]
MADWSDCFDPDELRIRLDVALEENAELREEIARLCSLLGRNVQAVGR